MKSVPNGIYKTSCSRTVLVKGGTEITYTVFFNIFSRDDLCSLKVLSEVDLKRTYSGQENLLRSRIL